MSIRRRLIALVLAVTVSVLMGVVMMPAVVWQMGGEQPIVAAAVVCTCGHGPDAQCAMHKHHGSDASSSSSPSSSSSSSSPSTPAPASGNRWCAGCPDGVDMITTAMIGFAAPIADRSEFAPPDGPSASIRAFAERPFDLVRPPLSPPPRS